MTLLPVKRKLYDIYKLRDEAESTTKDIVAKQNLGIGITKAIARDKPIIIFQQQNVVLSQTYNLVAEALEMIDAIEGEYTDVVPEIEEETEGEDAFKKLAAFTLLCFKRRCSWKEYKNVVHEAYMRTTIRNSRTWSEAAKRLCIQRTAIHRMATNLGVEDKPIDRR